MNHNPAFKRYVEELQTVIRDAGKVTTLEVYALELEEAMQKLQQVTDHLLKTSQGKGWEVFVADATLYVELFGIVTNAWQWLLQAVSLQKIIRNKKDLTEKEAHLYREKMCAIRFVFDYELPKVEGLKKKLLNADGSALATGESAGLG